MKRATVVYSGRVQGVGFRFTTARLSEDYPEISGYVANQPNGTVLLVAEGEEDTVRAFLGEIRQSGLGRYITDFHTEWGRVTGEFEGFTVRYR